MEKKIRTSGPYPFTGAVSEQENRAAHVGGHALGRVLALPEHKRSARGNRALVSGWGGTMSRTVRHARRRTLVAVGQIRGSVRRLETLLASFADNPGPGQPICAGPNSAPLEPGDVGTYCEGRR